MIFRKNKRLMLDHFLKDTKQISKMKKIALSPIYSCSGEMYKLLSYEVLHKLVKKIKKGEVHLSNKILYGRDIITTEEKFLENLNGYIGFVKDNYFIEHVEQLYLIELSLSNKYSEVLFSILEYTADENYKYYDNQFKRMFLYNFFNNIVLLEKYASEESDIRKFINKYQNYNFDSDEDIEKFERIFKKINSKRENGLFNAFVIIDENDENTLNFYLFEVERLLKKYFE